MRKTIYEIEKVKQENATLWHFSAGKGRYTVHEDIWPDDQISLNFDILRLSYKNWIFQNYRYLANLSTIHNNN